MECAGPRRMTDQTPTIRAAIFEGFGPFLATRGVSLAGILKAASINPKDFNPQTTDVTLDEAGAIFEHAAVAANDPCLGLHWAEQLRAGSTGAWGYMLTNARTLDEAMQAISRYISLIVHPTCVEFTKTQETASLTWIMPRSLTQSTVQYALFSAAATMLRLRKVAGPGWVPVAIEMPHRELPCTACMQRVFCCPITYNTQNMSLIVDVRDLGRVNASTDKHIFGVLEQLCDRMLHDLTGPPEIVDQVRRVIGARLTSGQISLDAVAAELDMAPRTLQSKLAAVDATFEAVLNESRLQLATGYLRDTDLPLTEIALLLGYSELSAFTRAAGRWFDASPSAHRQTLRQGTEKRTPRASPA
jgi:AraC-like DNA-binding protein